MAEHAERPHFSDWPNGASDVQSRALFSASNENKMEGFEKIESKEVAISITENYCNSVVRNGELC